MIALPEAMLQRRGRVTYRTLKAQFELDDDLLDILKDELLFSHPVVDEDGRGLVWTGDSADLETEVRRRPKADKQLYITLRAVTALLRQDERVTYQELRQIFGVDDAFLSDLRTEL